jgi:hypothetical protein
MVWKIWKVWKSLSESGIRPSIPYSIPYEVWKAGEKLMKMIIEKMRADWNLVVADRRACGDWSDADEAEIGAAVAADVKAGDPDTIVLWARWLADLAALAVGLKAAGHGANERIRAHLEAGKKEEKKK